MTATTPQRGLSIAQKKKAKDIFSSPLASAVAIVIAVIWTIPTFGLLVSSIRPEEDINNSGWWTFFSNPSFSLENYNQVLFEGTNVNPPLFQYFFNSLAVTIPAVIFPITLAVFAAYALAWFEFKGRDFLFFTIFALQVIPLQLALVPLLQLFSRGLVIGGVTLIPDLGITGTYIPIWIAHTIFGLPLAIFLLHNFLRQIPRELIEAGRVDGANWFTLFTKIVLPLSVPAIASFLIFQFLWVWNDLLVGLTFGAGSKDVAPMTVRLAEMVGTRGSGWEVLTAGAFVAIIVPLIVFFTLQRYFVRGLLAGSVKG
ncbi:MAG: sugar ABC transporter permease [Cellulomonadaceae bacterium TMED98]|jgi:alpha-glucoside transport system permease protein|nr:MAG: sugar ABC transporter permease [Cellulomonadaceae bacterium TMED98]CAI8406279.1 MAG: L-arabinose transport system permease protein AraQ [Cellulomonadaceae bacterium TMED98]|tara:strand:+ start:419 stop:1357 length:939 start_codon:yes stop_codon:yes gene_type:complete